MVKTVTACNWAVSRVTEEDLNEYVQTGVLAQKDVIHWRVPGTETPPEPKDGEVVVFNDQMLRGFSPPGSKFFRDVLHFFKLHPQDIDPNSVKHLQLPSILQGVPSTGAHRRAIQGVLLFKLAE